MIGGGAYYAAKYYVYRMIVSSTGADIRFGDLRLSLFPLGLEVRNIKNFPIKNENLVSFAAVNVYLPPTSLFMKKKAVSIEIEKPVFILDDSLLQRLPGEKALGSTFTVNHLSIRHGELIFKGRDTQFHMLDFNLLSGNLAGALAFRRGLAAFENHPAGQRPAGHPGRQPERRSAPAGNLLEG